MSNQKDQQTEAYLQNLGISKLNPMQEEFISKAQTEPNMMLLAPTGSGKTLAFLISVLNQLSRDEKQVQAIIIAPARELALQIENVFKNLKTSYKVSCCYGGHSMQIEQNSLRNAPAVLIATPGRLADHLDRESFDPSFVKVVVLDEFDKSLQMGFQDQIKMLFGALSGKQRHMLTSATVLDIWPDFLPFQKVQTVNYLKDRKESKLKLSLVKTKSAEKVETLMRLVATFGQDVSLVFCNHREAVERISLLFRNHNFPHGILQGAMEQIDREKNLIKFRSGSHTVLIATDLAARGLDIPEIKHVVHYQLPPKEDAFIHRNGRTARMHAEGQAYLVLADDEILPEYLTEPLEEIVLNAPLKLPALPKYECLYISAGKKDKISKGDIAGLLMKKVGLQNDDLGLITILDYASYVAVKRSLIPKVISSLKDERLKKIKVKIEIAS